MALIIRVDNEVFNIEPSNGEDFSLKELQKLVEGDIEIIPLGGSGRIMVINGNGKILNLGLNRIATDLALTHIRRTDYIVGNVLVCDKKQIK